MLLPSLHQRSGELELMDTAALTGRELEEVCRLMARVNRYLGGINAIRTHLENYSHHWLRDKKILILDVAAGAGDIPRALVRWARSKKLNISIVAADLNPDILRFAQKESAAYPEIRFVQADVTSLPFPDASFDYVISSLFFHHLKDPEIISALKNLDRIAARGIVVNDLLRCRSAYWGIFLLSRLTINRFFRNDAPLSVLRGFLPSEIKILALKAGLHYLRFHPHFAYRFALAGEKR